MILYSDLWSRMHANYKILLFVTSVICDYIGRILFRATSSGKLCHKYMYISKALPKYFFLFPREQLYINLFLFCILWLPHSFTMLYLEPDLLAPGATCFPVYTSSQYNPQAKWQNGKFTKEQVSVLVSAWTLFSKELKILLFCQQNVI